MDIAPDLQEKRCRAYHRGQVYPTRLPGRFRSGVSVPRLSRLCRPGCNIPGLKAGEDQADGRHRSVVRVGSVVDVVQKQHQQSGKTTRGIVASVLTNSSFHPHGIKVRLEDGKVGRVSAVIDDRMN